MKDPVRFAFQEFRNESCVQRMAGSIRHQPSQHRLADEREVPKQVERLMPHELILKTQRRIVEDSCLRQNDCVLQRAAADQAVRLQLLHLMIEAEGSRGRNEIRVAGTGELDVEALLSNQRMWKIDVAFDAERRSSCPVHHRVRVAGR